MALHEVQLKGYSVRPGNLSLGTFDSYGIEQLHVTADDSWDGLDILAVFHAPDGTATKVVVGADGMLAVPPEATAKQAGVGRIVFVGLAENVQRITVDIGYNIKPHSDIEGDNPGTPTPDVVQQILANSNNAVSIATAAREAAENAHQAAEDAAKKSAEDADNTANSIKDSMTQISENKEAVSQLKEDTAALKKRQNVLVGSETGNPVSCNDAYSAPLCGLTVYGKSTQDGTPTPDAPVPIVSAGDGGSVAVKVTGKNLFPVITNANISKINKPTGGVRYGYVFYVPAQSSVTASGNADMGTNCFVGDFDIKTQTYTQKAQLVSEKGGTYTAKLQSGWHVIYIANDYLPTILIKLNAAKIQLEIGTKATVYEPYREQLLTLPTPNGLPGIPVTSGGNYTDQSGQQWVCDEVDLERGVKVQRVKRVDISSLDKSYWDFRSDTGADTSSTRYKNDAVMIDFKSNAPAMNNILPVGVANIKNTFRLVATPLYLYQFNLDASEFPTVKSWTEYLEANTVLVIYALAIPIETPLTPAEIAAYKALTAYAPDTVVQASDGAGIKLDYQRDVNLVVKNLEDAIASMTTT